MALLAAVVVHWPALGTFFAQDDVTFLLRARGLMPTPWSLARPLSEGWTWRALDAVFGLHPLPYHVLLFALHLANTTLVYGIGARMFRSRGTAFAAAVVFGVSSIAFTTLHWISPIGVLMQTMFSLAAFHVWLIGRERSSTAWLWLSAPLVLLALLSKESAIFLPLVFVLAHWVLEPDRPRTAPTSSEISSPAPAPPRAVSSWRVLAPPCVVTAIFAIAFVATLRFVHYVGSEAYAMTFSPLFLARNLSTYLRWVVSPQVAVRDEFANFDPDALPFGIVVTIAVLAILWTQRRDPSHPEEVGVMWFLCALGPVIALKHHTYLYYVYPAVPGLAWLAAGAFARAVGAISRRSAFLGSLACVAAGMALLGLGWIEFTSVRARERAMSGNLPVDKTVRESMLLRNVTGELRASGLKPGTRIAFINPAPRQHQAMVDTARFTGTLRSYIPLEGALRGGQAIRLFFPGVQYLGFGDTLPRSWEDAEVYLFQDEGHVRDLGRGGRALSELGYFTLRLHDWNLAERMFQRSRQLGDTTADAGFGLIITRDYLGDHAGSDRYAAEFLRRWPNDERVPVVRGALERTGSASPPAPGAR